MTIDDLESLLAAQMFGADAWEGYVTEQGLDQEACGIFCARLAMHAVERLGLQAGDAEYDRIGAEMASVALSAFEAALRIKEARSARV